MFQRPEQEGQLSLIFADDSYLPTDSELECQKNVNASMGLLFKLVFVIHSDRLILKPTQKLVYFGFVIDSVAKVFSISRQGFYNIVTSQAEFSILHEEQKYLNQANTYHKTFI